MGAILDRFTRTATLLNPLARRHGVLLDPPRAAGITDKEWDGWVRDDIENLIARDRPTWLARQRALYGFGEYHFLPVANRGEFRGVTSDPPIVNQTAVTGGTAITALWDAADLTPMPASNVQYGLQAGQVFKVSSWGVVTTAVTGAQTATWTPIYGTTTGGTSLGASIAAPLEAKVFTNTMWGAEMWVHFRSVTQTGSTGLAMTYGRASALPHVGVAAGTAEGTVVPFGTGSTTATTVTTTAASGLLICMTPSLSTQSWSTLGVVIESLN